MQKASFGNAPKRRYTETKNEVKHNALPQMEINITSSKLTC